MTDHLTIYTGGPLANSAHLVIAGNGVFTLNRFLGCAFPTLQLACTIRGLPALPLRPLLVSLLGKHPASVATSMQPFQPTYHVVTPESPLPTLDVGRLYQYVIAHNGVFLLARTRDMELCLPLAEGSLPSLAAVTPFFRFLHPRVGELVVEDLLARARSAYRAEEGWQERLFYLLRSGPTWAIHEPEQIATARSVAATGVTAEYYETVLEGHSHQTMEAFFSSGDDESELDRVGIFFVLGRILTQPEILTRVCLHGYSWTLPAAHFFQLPAHIHDAAWRAR